MMTKVEQVKKMQTGVFFVTSVKPRSKNTESTKGCFYCNMKTKS